MSLKDYKFTAIVWSNLQWLTTHSLLQYSSSHSELAIAAFGHPWRMQVFPGRRLPGPGCCCCCCWACCCCTGAVGPLGEPAPPDTGPPGGGLDTKCWSLPGGLMWCERGTWRHAQISINWISWSDLTSCPFFTWFYIYLFLLDILTAVYL
jgi:hypothetical protein